MTLPLSVIDFSSIVSQFKSLIAQEIEALVGVPVPTITPLVSLRQYVVCGEKGKTNADFKLKLYVNIKKTGQVKLPGSFFAVAAYAVCMAVHNFTHPSNPHVTFKLSTRSLTSSEIEMPGHIDIEITDRMTNHNAEST